MKKYLLGSLAVVAAIVLSSFSAIQNNEADNNFVKWFDSSNNYVTTTSDLNSPDSGCLTTGGNCIRGYTTTSSIDHTYPGDGVTPAAQFKP